MPKFNGTPVEGEGSPEDIIRHIHTREGYSNRSYKDSLGKLTGGLGHLLTEHEQEKYPEGTLIPSDVLSQWEREDLEEAFTSAKKQADELEINDPSFIKALTSVNFQLGSNWNEDHKKTWKLLKEKNFEEAAEEAAISDWNKQTPNRVKDFQEAIRNLDAKI